MLLHHHPGPPPLRQDLHACCCTHSRPPLPHFFKNRQELEAKNRAVEGALADLASEEASRRAAQAEAAQLWDRVTMLTRELARARTIADAVTAGGRPGSADAGPPRSQPLARDDAGSWGGFGAPRGAKGGDGGGRGLGVLGAGEARRDVGYPGDQLPGRRGLGKGREERAGVRGSYEGRSAQDEVASLEVGSGHAHAPIFVSILQHLAVLLNEVCVPVPQQPCILGMPRTSPHCTLAQSYR